MNIFGKFYVRNIILFTLIFLFSISSCCGENYFVIADSLNGRCAPSKKASIEANFEYGDILTPIQLNENGWIEVYGGETGTVWCKAEYLSAYFEPVYYIADITVNLRENPSYDSSIIGKIKKGRTMKITAEVFGWGYIRKQGWVDLSYFVKVDN